MWLQVIFCVTENELKARHCFSTVVLYGDMEDVLRSVNPINKEILIIR